MATILLRPHQDLLPSVETFSLEPTAWLHRGRSIPFKGGVTNPLAALPAIASGRCPVKGCVFPVGAAGTLECRYHQLFRVEPHLFQSHQPSHLLALQAPSEINVEEPDGDRQRDRKRLLGEREEFLRD